MTPESHEMSCIQHLAPGCAGIKGSSHQTGRKVTFDLLGLLPMNRTLPGKCMKKNQEEQTGLGCWNSPNEQQISVGERSCGAVTFNTVRTSKPRMWSKPRWTRLVQTGREDVCLGGRNVRGRWRCEHQLQRLCWQIRYKKSRRLSRRFNPRPLSFASCNWPDDKFRKRTRRCSDLCLAPLWYRFNWLTLT